jgi:glycerol-3-phosphate O-acyltransferase / dihydroxyacetone phosphate acyltransferase
MSLFRRLSRIYYRFERIGAPLPEDGPLILVANHVNGLLDPAAMLHFGERELCFLGKEPLLRMPLFGWLFRSMEVVPVFRAEDGADTKQNRRTFEAVWRALESGRTIVMFPEGKSHDLPGLQPIKTGAARMALGTDPSRAGEVRIVPVGIVYERKKRFGSRATLLAHEAIDAGAYRTAGGSADREAVLALTARVEAALRDVTVDVVDHEDRPILEIAERIWNPAPGRERVERLAALARASADLRQSDPARIERLRGRLAAFAECLGPLGASVDHLDLRVGPAGALAATLRILFGLLVHVPLIAVAAVWWAVPVLLMHLIGSRAIRKPDLYGTYKALASFVLVPIWHVALCLWIWLGLGAGGSALAGFLLAPPIGVLAVHGFRRERWLWREALVFARLALSGRMVERLRLERADLAAEIEALAATVPTEQRRMGGIGAVQA